MLAESMLAGSKGFESLFVPELPAAKTFRMPAAPAASMAVFIACGTPYVPRALPQLLLLTRMLTPFFFRAVM